MMISVIAPAFNEAGCLPQLVAEIVRTLRPLEQPFEIILVDDASTDGTAETIRKLAAQYPEVQGIRHRLNCGQSAAVATGLRAARGRLTATLDADMQNPPSELITLLSALTPEVAAVCGVRRQRNDSRIRRLSSRMANAFRNAVTGVRVEDAGCGMRLIRRCCAAELPVFNGLHRFISTILRMQGYTVREVEVAHRPRLTGTSKYGIGNRLWRGIADCLAMRWYARRAIPGRRLEETL